MSLVVFLGPTLSVADAKAELDAIYLPPVAQGDLYRATLQQPFAIGIVDGYFERIPAVWHKEILWALRQGIHVFGAASMGALRAAELARYGMQGVGSIYQAFASGDLEDDDEVAIAHGDAETGYRQLSEAMVNIRATLAALEHRGHLPSSICRKLVEMAKRQFYPERCYPSLIQHAIAEGIPQSDIDSLRNFVNSARVDQKRQDALELLRTLKRCQADGTPAAAPTFTFSHTEAWDQTLTWAATQAPLF